MAELDPSKKVADRYLKREVLGEGTYGVVYKAIDTQVGFLPAHFNTILHLKVICFLCEKLITL